jgi:hypothetical protein
MGIIAGKRSNAPLRHCEKMPSTSKTKKSKSMIIATQKKTLITIRSTG